MGLVLLFLGLAGPFLGLAGKGDFALPVSLFESAASRGALDEPLPWYYLPFEGMSGEQEADEAWAELMLGQKPREPPQSGAADPTIVCAREDQQDRARTDES